MSEEHLLEFAFRDNFFSFFLVMLDMPFVHVGLAGLVVLTGDMLLC